MTRRSGDQEKGGRARSGRVLSPIILIRAETEKPISGSRSAAHRISAGACCAFILLRLVSLLLRVVNPLLT